MYNNTDTLNDGNAYIIMKGGIEEVDADGAVIRVYNVGQVCGLLALSTSTKRKCRAFATASTILASIHRITYEGLKENCVCQKNHIQETFRVADELKQSISAFHDFDNRKLRKVVSKCPSHRFLPGHVFCHEGQQLDGLYIVLSGKVCLTRHIVIKSKYQGFVDDYKTQVSLLGNAQWFGISAICSLLGVNGDGQSDVLSSSGVEDDESGTTSNDAEAKVKYSPARVNVMEELESYTAKTAVNVLLIPMKILQQLPLYVLRAFNDDYRIRDTWRKTAVQNAHFCRRYDILRTMCDKKSLTNVVEKVMLGFEKNPCRPSSPRIIKNSITDSVRTLRTLPLPNNNDIMFQKKQANAMTVVHSPVQHQNIHLLGGSFRDEHRRKNEAKFDYVTEEPILKQAKSSRQPSPRKTTIQEVNTHSQSHLKDTLKESETLGPETNSSVE